MTRRHPTLFTLRSGQSGLGFYTTRRDSALTTAVGGAKLKARTPLGAVSEEQLSALLATLKEDAGFREKLQGAGDLDAAVALAKDAGFDVSKADWLKRQARQALELSDEELEQSAGGFARPCVTDNYSHCTGLAWCATGPEACET